MRLSAGITVHEIVEAVANILFVHKSPINKAESFILSTPVSYIHK